MDGREAILDRVEPVLHGFKVEIAFNGLNSIQHRREVGRRLCQEGFLQAGNAAFDRREVRRTRHCGADGRYGFFQRGEAFIHRRQVWLGDGKGRNGMFDADEPLVDRAHVRHLDT